MKLFIIRHGEYQRGNYDYPDSLTPHGVRSMASLGEKLAAYTRDRHVVILSSKLSRAEDSARILSEKIGCTVTFNDWLREGSNYLKDDEHVQNLLTENPCDILILITHADIIWNLGKWSEELGIIDSQTYHELFDQTYNACGVMIDLVSRTCVGVGWYQDPTDS